MYSGGLKARVMYSGGLKARVMYSGGLEQKFRRVNSSKEGMGGELARVDVCIPVCGASPGEQNVRGVKIFAASLE